MPKIKYVDDLIDSIKIAYPRKIQPSDPPGFIENSIRDSWDKDRYEDIYQTLQTWRKLTGWDYVSVQSITNGVLATADEYAYTPIHGYNRLLRDFRRLKLWIEIEGPAAKQIEEDFRETFPLFDLPL